MLQELHGRCPQQAVVAAQSLDLLEHSISVTSSFLFPLVLMFSSTDVTSVIHWPRPHPQRERLMNSEVGKHGSCFPPWSETRLDDASSMRMLLTTRVLRARTTAEPTGACAHPAGAPHRIAGRSLAQDMRDPVLNSPVGTCRSPFRLKPTQELPTEDGEMGPIREAWRVLQ
ncbi:hypothetical protein PAL_GLEAN10008427 [Pteropus alecto]|uniref:Uncharacterized protein n=1 Tax=Pteropus alecto TaxID=9402 RepID=L5KDF4_PTEAL|nr:hypothetical protein PAL_GLEAN10008427 [Pteropus alecto]